MVKAVREEAKAKGANKVEISIDCVAYAPHRLIDVQDWDVDFCVFSYYKVWWYLTLDDDDVNHYRHDRYMDLISRHCMSVLPRYSTQ